MRITLMTPDQRAALAAQLGDQLQAAPELVSATVAAADDILGYGLRTPLLAAARTIAAGSRATAARLLIAEQLLATTRDTLARLAATGDDYSIPDVLYELDRAGAGLHRAELDHADAVIDAVGQAGAF